MARIRIKLRTSTVPGKSGTVFYQVTHKKEVKQITTHIRLLPDEWNEQEERIIVQTLSPASHLSALQREIESDLALLQRIIHQLELSGEDFGVDNIVEQFHTFQESAYVLDTLDKEIDALVAKGKLGTAKNRRCCRNSLAEYLQGKDIPFREVTESLVSAYEEWLLEKGVKRNTTSSYMRSLQSIYNKVSKQGLIQPSGNPFGNVYTGVDKTSKRAVDEQVVADLKALDLSATPWLAQARDFFLFSYCTRGMTFVDMAYLKQENIVNGVIRYSRKKTRQPLVVHIEPCVQDIIDRYRDASSHGYVLPIIHSDNAQEAYGNYQSALRYYNMLLKKLSPMLGAGISLTSYTSRHSYATALKRAGVSTAIISESLGHNSEKTTQIYLDSISEEVIDRTNAELVASLDKKSKLKNEKSLKKSSKKK